MLLEDHCEALEGDLALYAHERLGDLFTGAMSFRRLKVLVDRLPPESALMTALRESLPADELAKNPPVGHGPWSRVEHLLARIGDGQEHGNWLFAMANRGSSALSAPPPPYPRPGVAQGASVTPINDEAVRYLERLRAGHGAPTREATGD